MRNLVIRFLALVLIGAWFLTLRPLALGGPASYIIVNGHSMEPTFYTGDLVILKKKSSYEIGDVAAYSTPNGNVIHRIVERRADGSYVLLGDNKNAPDPVFPKDENILGAQLLLVPNGGDVLMTFQQPVPFALLVGGMLVMTFWKRRQLSSFLQRRLRRRQRHAGAPALAGLLGGSDQSRAMTVFSASLAVTLVCFLTAFYALRQPVTSASGETPAGWLQRASFDWEISVEPSTLYPDDRITSDEVAPVTSEEASGQPVYLQLAREIDLRVDYALVARESADVAGDLGVTLDIQAVDGWTKSLELRAPESFDGTSASADVTISVPEIKALLATIEEETGFRPSSYQLTVTPRVTLAGTVDGAPVETQYAPGYTFELTSTTIVPRSELLQEQPQAPASVPLRDNAVTIAGLDVGVRPLRWIGGTGALLGALVTLAVAASVFLGLGRGEVGRIQARYGAILIEVREAELPGHEARIEVASIEDLARLAKRDGGIIFHQHAGDAARRYFVPDGATVYAYTASAG